MTFSTVSIKTLVSQLGHALCFRGVFAERTFQRRILTLVVLLLAILHSSTTLIDIDVHWLRDRCFGVSIRQIDDDRDGALIFIFIIIRDDKRTLHVGK